MPTRERLHGIGLRQAAAVRNRLGSEARILRVAAGLSQQAVAAAAGVSRDWLADLEYGRLDSVDLRRCCLVFACLGQRLSVKAFPTGPAIRDAGQLRLLHRFNARLHSAWRVLAESPMPIAGDLRAWDELLVGPVRIGVEAFTRLTDLQAAERSISGKQRDSNVRHVILLVADTRHNRDAVRDNIASLRRTFPLDTRAALAALGAGRDPGASGLVLL